MTAKTGHRAQVQIAMLAGLMFGLLTLVARSQSAVAFEELSLWTAPTAIVTGLTDAAHPSLAHTADGQTHAVWESNGTIYFASRPFGGAWGQPIELAAGSEPGMVVAANGVLHVVFSNRFFGNYEIYHVHREADGTWTLPTNISHTPGDSMSPAVAADSQGGLHVTWTDKTPGYETIYYGRWDGQFWSAQPASNGRGQAPTIAVGTDGTTFIAWQDWAPGAKGGRNVYDILLIEFANGAWSVPLNVSDRPDMDSIGASITATSDSMAHITWAEGGSAARYCFAKGTYLATVRTVAVAAAALRGPKIVAEMTDLLRVGWDEGDAVRVTAAPARALVWPRPELVSSLPTHMADVALTSSQGGGATVAWVQADSPASYGIYLSTEQPAHHRRVWIPLIRR